tara:strand:- start:187 stop:633 length:447 start_codon:yes stop_codon:yes gene_type:complete
MKKKILIFILLFVYSCGYSPIYKNSNIKDYEIILSTLNGDVTMNNLIKNEIETYSKKNSSNQYIVELNSSYSKKTISRDSSGIASNYELMVVANFTVGSENFIFKEKLNVKKISDTIEQRNYENIIKKNFAASIREKLLIKLLNKNDN